MKIQDHKTIIDPNMTYETPQWLFDKLNAQYHFTVDAAANDSNHKIDNYWTIKDDGLSQDWSNHVVWCNPPYDRTMGKWVKKAHDSWKKGATVVMLIPVKTDTSYFHDYILHKAKIIVLRGRIKFSNSDQPAIFPSMLVIYEPSNKH